MVRAPFDWTARIIRHLDFAPNCLRYSDFTGLARELFTTSPGIGLFWRLNPRANRQKPRENHESLPEFFTTKVKHVVKKLPAAWFDGTRHATEGVPCSACPPLLTE